MPRNALSDRPYRGINPIVLSLTAELEGYGDPRWCTFKQAQLRGGHVRKGEHGTGIVFWRWLERPDPDDAERVKRFPMLRVYSVFNVAQTDGLDLADPPAVVDVFDPIEAAENIVTRYLDAPTISHDGGERAYYVPPRDTIHMPPRAAFESADAYYGVQFHELGHSTGHPSRLARKTLCDGAPFGSETYSSEELVAEFASAFLSTYSNGRADRARTARTRPRGWGWRHEARAGSEPCR
jgi:antirestriction protein ArdC